MICTYVGRRLIARGTIEEKVYHRQIYKHALSTRVLSDPRQQRHVARSGLRELFTLTDRHNGGDTETGRLWQKLGADVVERGDPPLPGGPGEPPRGSGGPSPDGKHDSPLSAGNPTKGAPPPSCTKERIARALVAKNLPDPCGTLAAHETAATHAMGPIGCPAALAWCDWGVFIPSVIALE